MFVLACFLFLAHAVLPHEHEDGHIAEILHHNTHSHHDSTTTSHDHDHDQDSNKNKSDGFCLFENVILTRTISISDHSNNSDQGLADAKDRVIHITVSNFDLEPPEEIPDKTEIADYFILLCNPNFMSSGLRAPPFYC
jgi:hypothetical protein